MPPPSPPPRHRQERRGCGCWAVLVRGLRGSCFRPAAAAAATAPAGAAVKGGHVYDAAETRYLNSSNRDLADHFHKKLGDEKGVDASIEKKISPKLLEFTFQELKSATVNFRPDSILGEGGFGYVFKGWIEPNSTAPAKPGTGLTVAVKSLKENALQGHREWVAEVDFLGQLHHKHLVKLIGYCIEDDQRLLVYEFMARGSLENHLFRSEQSTTILLLNVGVLRFSIPTSSRETWKAFFEMRLGIILIIHASVMCLFMSQCTHVIFHYLEELFSERKHMITSVYLDNIVSGGTVF